VPLAGLSSGARALRNALVRARRHPPLAGPGSLVGRRGEGYEFVELREYQSGDDPRRIDWAATARSGTMQTRVFLEENPLEIVAVIDASPSMSVGRARSLAAGASDAAQAWLEIADSGDRTKRIESAEVDGALRILRGTARTGAAVLIVSDFYWLEAAPEFERIAIELARRTDVTALIARDPWYDALPLHGLVRLRDAESNQARTLYVGARERRNYAQAVRAREEALRARLRHFGWRTGLLHETDGRRSLYETFGIV
jgi:uncharacterized protein (DUF58 family)